MNCEAQVTLVEWLTRGPAIKLGRAFGRVGSNPAGDDFFLVFSGDLSSFITCFRFASCSDLWKEELAMKMVCRLHISEAHAKTISHNTVPTHPVLHSSN